MYDLECTISVLESCRQDRMTEISLFTRKVIGAVLLDKITSKKIVSKKNRTSGKHHMWEEERGIFANRFQHHASQPSTVHSPTWFSGGVSDKTVDRMATRPLLNTTWYCLDSEDELFDIDPGCRYVFRRTPAFTGRQ